MSILFVVVGVLIAVVYQGWEKEELESAAKADEEMEKRPESF
jgi:hypothetical protein